MPLISLIVCTYNDAPHLGAALDSALAQTLPADRFEVLVVDDGSTDGTPAVIDRYRDRPNLRAVRHPENLGLPAACNHGLREARGAWLVRLDADDTCEPRMLEALAAPLAREATDLVYADRWEWWPAEGRRARVAVEPFRVDVLIAAGVLLRRSILDAIGGYRPLFWEEYDLYLRYLQHSGRPPVRVPQPLMTYTKRAGSMTADPARVREGWRQLQALWPAEVLARFGCAPPAEAQGATA